MSAHSQSSPLIVGAGPTGLAAALFLAERGVTARLIDSAAEASRTSRAQVVNPRTLELLEPSGVTQAILGEGRPIKGVRFYEGWKPLATIDFSDLPARHAMTVLPQARTEALLTEALARHGIAVERSTTFAGLRQTADAVMVDLAANGQDRSEEAPLLLAADGAHSRVREVLGIGFDGHGFPEDWPLYDIALDDPLDLDHAHVSFVPEGLIFLLAIRPGLWRVFGDMPDLLTRMPPGTRIGASEWESSFHIADKRAERLTAGRIALAGDAAHIHSPIGARGMNLGIEDAFVFAACAADALDGQLDRIDDYGRLRMPIHKRVVSRMDRLTTLARGQTPMIALLRRYLFPAVAHASPLTSFMQTFVAGLDHQVETI
jgi:2-polyprenyl-6-methoxyphenol hydroxylase-like FAD-dependent oxidoreductase